MENTTKGQWIMRYLVLFLVLNMSTGMFAEEISAKQRELQLELAKVKLRLIEQDEELFQLHRKIIKLHRLLAEKLSKKSAVIKLEKKLKQVRIQDE